MNMLLSRTSFVFGLVACIAGPGCVVDPTSEASQDPAAEENVGSSAAALTTEGGVTATGPANITLGAMSSQTCFLSGIGGSLLGTPNYFYNPSLYNPAVAGVFPGSDGNWHLIISNGTGSGVAASVVCIDSTINRTTITGADNLTSTGYQGNSSTQCFLQSVKIAGGLASSGDTTRITNNGTNYWSFTSVMANTTGDNDWGVAQGRLRRRARHLVVGARRPGLVSQPARPVVARQRARRRQDGLWSHRPRRQLEHHRWVRHERRRLRLELAEREQPPQLVRVRLRRPPGAHQLPHPVAPGEAGAAWSWRWGGRVPPITTPRSDPPPPPAPDPAPAGPGPGAGWSPRSSPPAG